MTNGLITPLQINTFYCYNKMSFLRVRMDLTYLKSSEKKKKRLLYTTALYWETEMFHKVNAHPIFLHATQKSLSRFREKLFFTSFVTLSVFENAQTFLLIEKKHGTFNTRGQFSPRKLFKNMVIFPLVTVTEPT